MTTRHETPDVSRFADKFNALGAEPRLRIMQELLEAHPDGMVAGEIQADLSIAASTLSHHLDRLRHEGLIGVERQSTFLRYRAEPEALRELLSFLFAECCSRSQAVKVEDVLACCSK